jgi:hypothetical protein
MVLMPEIWYILVIDRSAAVWNPSQQPTKGNKGPNFVELWTRCYKSSTREGFNILIDNSAADTGVHTKHKADDAENNDHSRSQFALRQQ